MQALVALVALVAIRPDHLHHNPLFMAAKIWVCRR
jgi:hypothetical protein